MMANSVELSRMARVEGVRSVSMGIISELSPVGLVRQASPSAAAAVLILSAARSKSGIALGTLDVERGASAFIAELRSGYRQEADPGRDLCQVTVDGVDRRARSNDDAVLVADD